MNTCAHVMRVMQRDAAALVDALLSGNQGLDTRSLVATFRDSLGFGMVDLCIKDVTCRESLNWTPRHFDQGFAWRQGRVGFLAIDSAGPIAVHIWLADTPTLRPDTLRAVRVPFTIPTEGCIQISCGWNIPEFPPSYPLPAGDYALTFAIGHDPALATEADREAYIRGFWCDFTFASAEMVEPAIVKDHGMLTPEYPLLMHSGFAVLNTPPNKL